MGDRRAFFQSIFGAVAGSLLLPGCKADTPMPGAMYGPNHKVGHLLRDVTTLPEPTEVIHKKIAIVGGGVTGLSALRCINRLVKDDVVLLELENETGGNARSGQNNVSRYPLGAHYLPLPDHSNKELITFLQEAGCITGFDAAGLPIYNEYYLCHDPEERLFMDGRWHEGLIPTAGVPQKDREEILRFLHQMDLFREKTDVNGNDHFKIPLDASVWDKEASALDKITFASWLAEHHFSSPYLLWYLNYCCKDDYGSTIHNTSAWAGIHYFAARKGKSVNGRQAALLTWPEGNAFLVQALKKAASGVTTGALVLKVSHKPGDVRLLCYRPATQKTFAIQAEKVLFATPQYVNKHLLAGVNGREAIYGAGQYAPWVVANISLSKLPNGKGMPFCWDNVMYGTESVGYVYAGNQGLGRQQTGVITWYLPVTGGDTAAARKQLSERTHAQWCNYIIKELEFAHKDLRDCITSIDVWVWGHGMIRPVPGYITSEARKMAQRPIDNTLFFAHTDLSGISIFEEAFYQGIRAANEMLM